MERRDPDYKTWAYRIAAGAGIAVIIFMIPVFCSLLQNYLGLTVAALHAENAAMLEKIVAVKKDTEDLPTMRVQMGILWKEAGHK